MGDQEMMRPYRFCEQKIVVFWFNPQIFEYRIRPKALHVILGRLAGIARPYKPFGVVPNSQPAHVVQDNVNHSLNRMGSA